MSSETARELRPETSTNGRSSNELRSLLSGTDWREGARQRVLEKGLLAGYWNIGQFNMIPQVLSGQLEPVFPSLPFLAEHPEFESMDFRDLNTYRANHPDEQS